MPLETLKSKRKRLWKEHLFDTRGSESESRQELRLQLVDQWSKDPWLYLTGRDLPDLDRYPEWPEGRPIYWTVDERDDENPVKPFPAVMQPDNWIYLKHALQELFGSYRIVLWDKARQIYATTLCMGALDWYCSFNDERETIVSRVKEESATKLINDRIRTPHSRKPKWLQDLMDMSEVPQRVIEYGRTGSTVTAVAQNVARSDARGLTGSIIMVDEAAYQDDFPDLYRAVLPMTSRLWAVTTANIGNPGAQVFRDLIMEGRPGRYVSGDDRGDVPEDPGTAEHDQDEDGAEVDG